MDDELRTQLAAIKIRNARVEADKAWETSWARRLLIASMTYVFAVLLFITLNAQSPFLTALLPAAAYVISTLSLSVFKDMWLQGHNK